MGTFILVLFGDGSVAQVLLSKEQKGNYESIAWGWVSEHSTLPMSRRNQDRYSFPVQSICKGLIKDNRA